MTHPRSTLERLVQSAPVLRQHRQHTYLLLFLLCASPHSYALCGAPKHRMQIDDVRLQEGHLAVLGLMVYLRSVHTPVSATDFDT